MSLNRHVLKYNHKSGYDRHNHYLQEMFHHFYMFYHFRMIMIMRVIIAHSFISRPVLQLPLHVIIYGSDLNE